MQQLWRELYVHADMQREIPIQEAAVERAITEQEAAVSLRVKNLRFCLDAQCGIAPHVGQLYRLPTGDRLTDVGLRLNTQMTQIPVLINHFRRGYGVEPFIALADLCPPAIKAGPGDDDGID